MLRKIIKDYFSFTKKERIGVIILVFLIAIIFVVPYLLPEKKESINKAKWEQFKAESARLFMKEKTPPPPGDQSSQRHSLDGKELPHPGKVADPVNAHLPEPELFYFDPNTLQRKGWERLGLRSKTITTIENYLSKGGKFRHAQDLGKIYGLHENELQRLIPYVKIISIAKDARRGLYEDKAPRHNFVLQPASNKSPSVTMVDINTADTNMLIALPGIGSKLAGRILHFREKLGAFYSIDQLSDIYGLPDSTFQKLRSRLTISAKECRVININNADVNELKELPYLKWNTANAIVEFRRQHGPFQNLEELLQIDIFTPVMLKKMAPYLSVQ